MNGDIADKHRQILGNRPSDENNRIDAGSTPFQHPKFEPQPWCGQHLSNAEPTATKYLYSQSEQCKRKTPMCRVAELARLHKLKHEYKLMDESGPAHRKQFTVSLMLTPNEVYYGCGASIKKAQQAAAENALRSTKLQLTPERHKCKEIARASHNPMVLLRYVTQKLGIEYAVQESIPEPLIPPPPLINAQTTAKGTGLANTAGQMQNFLPISPRNGFVAIRSAAPIFTPKFNVPFPSPTNLLPNMTCFNSVPMQNNLLHEFQVRIFLKKQCQVFIGRDLIRRNACNSAAIKALNFLKPKLSALEAEIKNRDLRNGFEQENVIAITNESDGDLKTDVTTSRNVKTKSPISKIHECALQMRMDVEFSVLKEEGPAHDRHFIVQCKLHSAKCTLTANGEGGNKKVAKQNACTAMLIKLQSIESSPIFIASTIYKAHKKNGQCKETKRKTISKDLKMDPSYGQQINPISRLIQVIQTRKESEPKFQLLMERGQNRYKEFVVEVTDSNGLRCEGTGPNKKLAKRAAAEAMLAAIGYEKPMPKPGKSLLKKREKDQAACEPIGVFDFNELLPKKDENNATAGSIVSAVNGSYAEYKDKENNDENNAAEIATTHENASTKCNNSVPISEVNLSVTATIGSHVMTFVDVDKVPFSDEGAWNTGSTETNFFITKDSVENAKENYGSTAKRRVTFSNQVSACSAPEESDYPLSSLMTLKTDDVKKPCKKGKNSKRKLNAAEKFAIAEIAQRFFGQMSLENRLEVNTTPAVVDSTLLNEFFEKLALMSVSPQENGKISKMQISAKSYLDIISELYKFTVIYTDFPKEECLGVENYFALVTIGIDKPLVCHGSGISEESSHETAATNVLKTLSQLAN